jgi:SAM-dependent methyltransferase
VTGLPDWAAHGDLLAYYERHRNRPEDLYPSEARFLPWLAASAGSVLDVGCAAGGFRAIWRQLAPGVRYAGVDLAPTLVQAARRLHPDATFHQGDVLAGLDLPDRYATVVQALGWLHWVEDSERALRELWRLADRFLFFDLRIVGDAAEARVGRQHLALVGALDGHTETPYVTVALPELARRLVALGPAVVYGYGYWGRPSDLAVGVGDDVCFATFVLERGDDADRPRVCLDMPLSWPGELAEAVEVLPRETLAELVPSQ